jgi:cobalt-precorrin 5A hydrolase
VVNGEEVGVYQSCGEQDWLTEEGRPDNIHIFTDLESMQKAACAGTIIITDRLLDEELPEQAILYRPKSLVVGIGCNRGVSCSRIEEAAQMVLINNGLSIKSIRNIATIELKRDEAGLLEFAQKYVFPVEFFTEEALSQVEFPSSPSNLIYNNVGTYAVCEPAALLSSKNTSLIVPKTKVSGDVTIAVARISRARKKLQ